jgi:signal peptidase I
MARYHHVEPLEDQWEAINAGEGAGLVQSLQKDSWQGRLIVDSYAYNSSRGVDLDPKNPQARPLTPPRFREQTDPYGRHWVDDLALECTAEVKSTSGLLRCDLVRGGMYYVCRIDVASGQATLSQEGVNAQMGQFGEGAELYTSVVGSTSVRGPGTYRLRLTNVDHQLRLWVNDTEIAFNGPTVYASPALVMPDVSQPHRGDLAPAGVGGQNVQVAFRKLRILRDKYYTLDIETPDYDARKIPLEYQSYTPTEIARDALAFPNPVTLQALLPTRGFREIQLGADQFMPLGDNSPASSDARFWERKYVERRLLIGRAVCIYWPHSWWNPLGWPNFRRMQPIH